MDIQSEVKTIILPYRSLSRIAQTEKQDEPIYMYCINNIPFGNVNRLQFGLHELPRLIPCKALVTSINTTKVCLKGTVIYDFPFEENIKNRCIYRGIYNKRKRLNLRKNLLLENTVISFLKEIKMQKRFY